MSRRNPQLNGSFHTDRVTRAMYATDASVYREIPEAVAYPKDASDLQTLIDFARESGSSLIPRTAGTSLAGQCVGSGIVADVSRHMNKVIEINKEEAWVRVQPGVIRDELNHILKPYGLFFGPNTSTSNRAMIGGMVGNNSCGSYSIVYGVTRDHVSEIHGLLSDGSTVHFKDLTTAEFEAKLSLPNLEGEIYRQLYTELSDAIQQDEIRSQFPNPKVHRRNTGYAVDLLLKNQPFKADGAPFNLCKMLCGSEGTLCLFTEFKLKLVPVPPSKTQLLCPQFSSIREALVATNIAMKHQPRAVELIDKTVLDCTKTNIAHRKNRFFIKDDPEALLIIEFGSENESELTEKCETLKKELIEANLGYYHPVISGAETEKVWSLRKAGLGLLSNLKGRARPVAVVEDTAVPVEVLPDYIDDFAKMMAEKGQKLVYYAHAGAGELHLRPVLDLRIDKDLSAFVSIAEASADLVKCYNGSLSGEHGDGRVRSPLIKRVLGDSNYRLFQRIKLLWDPQNIFNPGKITNAAPITESLRADPLKSIDSIPSEMRYNGGHDLLPELERCNGSGDCRKLHFAGGTMCPSYRATRNEKDSTRGRANALREALISNDSDEIRSEDLADAMALCLGCKACKRECPSNIDMARMKAEYLHKKRNSGAKLKSDFLNRNFTHALKFGSRIPRVLKPFAFNSLSQQLLQRTADLTPNRQLPFPVETSCTRQLSNRHIQRNQTGTSGKVALFIDEITNYLEPQTGVAAFEFFVALGYDVLAIDQLESARNLVSAGLLQEAAECAVRNIDYLNETLEQDIPIVGVEPSAILGFRDEIPDLVPPEKRKVARSIAKKCFLFEEFVQSEIKRGVIQQSAFKTDHVKLSFHAHCHQKALSDQKISLEVLNFPEGVEAELIYAGCCGMAGMFGYQKSNYDISMKIGDEALFPYVNRWKAERTIIASGSSCRHQIFDGTQVRAIHPVEFLRSMLKP